MNTASLKQDYQERIVPILMKEFNYTTVMQCPKLQKIVLNQGLQFIVRFIDNSRLFGREGMKIPCPGRQGPQSGQQQLRAYAEQQVMTIRQTIQQQPDHDADNAIRKQGGQHLTVNHFRQTVEGHPEGIVNLAEHAI